MSFLLDTDICSAHTKDDRVLFPRFMQHAGQLYVSMVTVGELITWTHRRNATARRKLAIERLLSDVQIMDVTRDIAEQFGLLRAALLDRGQFISTADGFIAATALVHNLTLISHNTRDFQTVGGLKLDDWLVP